MAQAAQPPQTAETYDNGAQNVLRGRGRPPIMCHKCGAFGHTRKYCPNNCKYLGKQFKNFTQSKNRKNI